MSCWSGSPWRIYLLTLHYSLGSPGGSVGKEFACNAGDLGSVSGLGRCPGGGNGNPPRYSGLENSMDRGAWQASDLFRPQELDMTEWLIPYGSLETWAFPKKIPACMLSHSNRVQLFVTPWTAQARILEWVAFPLSSGSSLPRDRTQDSCIADRFFTSWAYREAQEFWVAYPFSSRSSQHRNWTKVSCIAGKFFTNWAIREAQFFIYTVVTKMQILWSV